MPKRWIPERKPNIEAGTPKSAAGQWAAYINSLPPHVRSGSYRITRVGVFGYDQYKDGVRAFCTGGPLDNQAAAFGTSHPWDECPLPEWRYRSGGRSYFYRWVRVRRDGVHLYEFDRDEPYVPERPNEYR